MILISINFVLFIHPDFSFRIMETGCGSLFRFTVPSSDFYVSIYKTYKCKHGFINHTFRP